MCLNGHQVLRSSRHPSPRKYSDEELIAIATEFKGTIKWDTSKPDGTPRKLLDISRAQTLGWQPTISLKTGIKSTIDDYIRTVDTQ